MCTPWKTDTTTIPMPTLNAPPASTKAISSDRGRGVESSA